MKKAPDLGPFFHSGSGGAIARAPSLLGYVDRRSRTRKQPATHRFGRDGSSMAGTKTIQWEQSWAYSEGLLESVGHFRV